MDSQTRKNVKRAKDALRLLDLVTLPEVSRIEPRLKSGHLFMLSKWTEVNGLPLYRFPPLKSAFVPRVCLPILSAYADGQREFLNDPPLKLKRQVERARNAIQELGLISATELIKRLELRPKWFWTYVEEHPEEFVVFPPSETTFLPGASLEGFETIVKEWKTGLAEARRRRREVLEGRAPYRRRVIPTSSRPTPKWSIDIGSEANPLVDFDNLGFKAARKSVGMKQIEVARAMGMSRATYLRIEDGTQKPARLELDQLRTILIEEARSKNIRLKL